MGSIAALKRLVFPAILLAAAGQAGAVPVRGRVLAEGAQHPVVGAVVELRSTSGALRRATTDHLGRYVMSVPPGRYYLASRHPAHLPFSSRPVSLQVTGVPAPALEIRLPSAAVTTVLLLRHAEREVDDRLSPAGWQRAQQLVHVAQKAAVMALYATDTQRSRETVAPLAAALGLVPIIYASAPPDLLADQIRGQPAGSTVLVAAHSDTLGPVITALGGNAGHCTLSGDEFDNLCVVRLPRHGPTHVINLQYGAPSPAP